MYFTRLYVRPISSKRKSCSWCKEKLGHGTEWACGYYLTGKWRNAIDRFCRRCWDAQCRQMLPHDLKTPPELKTYHCQQPYWLYIPGTSPLTKQEFDWCKQISSFLGRDVVFQTNCEFGGTYTFRQTGAINILRTDWEYHPLKDWCEDQGIHWDFYGESHELTGDSRTINIWFGFPSPLVPA